MIKAPTIPTLIDPKLIDVVLLEIQTGLAGKLSWLNHAFGKAQMLSELKDNRIIKSPSVYIGKEDYLSVFPDSHIGNFIFFDVDDGQQISNTGRKVQDYRAKVGLIVWFDFRTVYPTDWKNRTVENVKSDVVDAVNSLRLVSSQIRMTTYWETAERVYKGYTDKEIKNQFYMRPFGGFRIDLDMKYFSGNKC